MASIEPFQISIPPEKLDLLQRKLSLTTLPDELDSAEWEYGAPLADITRLIQHWQTGYDWRAHEQRLNDALPQFTTDIDVEGFGSLNIHFVHRRGNAPQAIPLLFCHGWPGHFMEVLKILPGLVDGGKEWPAFTVVAPSLPNFGFSEGVKKKGFALPQYAEVCHKLMLALGYTEYVTQGGDWGYFITRAMGRAYPKHCVASHVNMAIPFSPKITQPLLFLQFLFTPYGPDERARIAHSRKFQKDGMGYFGLQSTKPQTIGYSQADSPVGLLAWIYEKLHDWTDAFPWTDDDVLTWISIYLFSRAGPAAASRIYYEATHDTKSTMFNTGGAWLPRVKLGITYFPFELAQMPKLWSKTMGPLVFQRKHEKGGHFAAWENPEAIVSDLRVMFGKSGGAYRVVKGHSGYSENGGSRL